MHAHLQSLVLDTGGWSGNERRVLDFSKHNRAQVRRALDSLPHRGSFEIGARRKPGHLFFELEHYYGQNFYWWPLERGPILSRVMLAKRPLRVQPTVASIMAPIIGACATN